MQIHLIDPLPDVRSRFDRVKAEKAQRLIGSLEHVEGPTIWIRYRYYRELAVYLFDPRSVLTESHWQVLIALGEAGDIYDIMYLLPAEHRLWRMRSGAAWTCESAVVMVLQAVELCELRLEYLQQRSPN